MDRIEKFLGRRPIKNRRKVKCNGREHVITKEDLKVIRAFRKNVCMDPDVDLYRPLNLSFSRKTMNGPILEKKERKDKSQSTYYTPRILRKSIRQYIPQKDCEQLVNTILDVWEDEGMDDLNAYEQDIFVNTEEQYTGAVEKLSYRTEDLKKSLRRIYLRLYDPREKKEFKLKDFVKEMPKPETLGPFPKEIGLSYCFDHPVRINVHESHRMFASCKGRVLEVYEFDGFVKVVEIVFDSDVRAARFAIDGLICVLVGDSAYIVSLEYEITNTEMIADAFSLVEMKQRKRSINGWDEQLCTCAVLKSSKKVNNIEVHQNGKYLGVVSGKEITVCDLTKWKAMKICLDRGKTPLKMRFHRTLSRIIVSTTNSIIVYDLVTRKTVCEGVGMSFVFDFCLVNENVVALVNNLNKVVLYDHVRNEILRTMVQEQIGIEVAHHRKYNLMCVSYPTEMIVFYNDISNDLVVPLHRISGKYRDLAFHPVLPWLYGISGKMLYVFT
ncbi:hypothetical protein CWI42_021030 [Ordospora colligata]|uniref:Uncharacterized protein n=1 Tax=Ordospora colligata OC4 TaxID=1354746 RepID=A0A0B2UGV1_9MICR|nr:uncharacterized protein M896_021040 [Ordospora colligata OC4]KHN70266.1 hypothetical protein M896_021040 [Ordospora colligata OC4]TBU16810.1 hypothetical protein CWI41_021050 [Ordospora colligata]TBU19359.1 hypothetical protein CWI42_021030 [Ordospora colligata]